MLNVAARNSLIWKGINQLWTMVFNFPLFIIKASWRNLSNLMATTAEQSFVFVNQTAGTLWQCLCLVLWPWKLWSRYIFTHVGLNSKLRFVYICSILMYTNLLQFKFYQIEIKLVFMFVVFVLMGWPLLPNALRHFQIYCAPLNLGILGREYAD